ncbi:MAG: TRAP transporter small permease subunit [Rubrimonas sp.]
MSHAIPTADTAARPKTAFARGVAAFSTLCGVVAAAMIFVAVLLTCQMIFVRFALGQSTVWQTETVIYLSIAATLLGLPYVQLLRGHVNVDLMQNILPPVARKALTALILLLTIFVMGIMAWYGFEMFEVAWRRGWRSDTVWGPPLWIPYLALPVGFGAYILQLLSDLVDELAKPAGDV